MILVAFFIAASSYTLMSFKANQAPTTYFYNSVETDEGDFADLNHWDMIDTSNECQTRGERPCSITVPDGSSLSDLISGKLNDQVLSISDERKP